MEIVYIQLKKDVHIDSFKTIYLEDIAQISSTCEDLRKIPIYTVTNKDGKYVVLDSFIVMTHLHRLFPEIKWKLLGPTQSLLRIKVSQHVGQLWKVVVVWMILFIGTGMTIMNFHYDVSMQEVQQKLHLILTGKQNEFPLLIQIPYSFGLGIGMLLFFNYWFKKKITDEPSPLEIELFNYQQQIDAYTLEHDAIKVKDSSDE